jgi:hypothetical protein
MNDHPPTPPREVVFRDHGGWISGSSLTTEPVAAIHITAGDVLAYDGMAVTVTATRATQYRFGAELADGVAIDWESGNRLGRLFRRDDDVLQRVEIDDDLCPQAKVPCEANMFDMCKTCGRDLSGNPDA